MTLPGFKNAVYPLLRIFFWNLKGCISETGCNIFEKFDDYSNDCSFRGYNCFYFGRWFSRLSGFLFFFFSAIHEVDSRRLHSRFILLWHAFEFIIIDIINSSDKCKRCVSVFRRCYCYAPLFGKETYSNNLTNDIENGFFRFSDLLVKSKRICISIHHRH